jgi:hypothetical protein
MGLILNVGKGAVLAAMFAIPSAPPMKTGLWESTNSLTITLPGKKTPARAPIVQTTRSCVTSGSWTKAFGNSGRAAACTRLEERFADGRLSFDLNCPNLGGTGHGEMTFQGTTGRGRVHLDMKPAGQAVSSDTAIESRYIGASCGSVLPGKTVVVQ